MSLDQLYTSRPITKLSNYKCPIKGLYLCGSGAHPGIPFFYKYVRFNIARKKPTIHNQVYKDFEKNCIYMFDL